MMDYVIKAYNALPQEALQLRITVFVEEQGFTDEVDAFDSVATHLVMFEGEEAIATCRFFLKEDNETYMFGRLCVLKEYRGKALGREMLKKVEEIVKEKGGKAIILHSQYHAKDFYVKCGFTQQGEIDYEQNKPHAWMRKEV